eukprot:3339557-Amphidinium_carterae.1
MRCLRSAAGAGHCRYRRSDHGAECRGVAHSPAGTAVQGLGKSQTLIGTTTTAPKVPQNKKNSNDQKHLQNKHLVEHYS